MHFVPIPTTHEALRGSSHHWLPFIRDISRRSHEPLDKLLDLVVSGEVQLGLVWDGQLAHALLGIRLVRDDNGDLVGEIVWLIGKGAKDWLHLRPELEKYLSELGCKKIRPIAPRAWWRRLKDHGYEAKGVFREAEGFKKPHLILEKQL